eukprot:9711449-Lingulodinium_polyedra.AAC.1
MDSQAMHLGLWGTKVCCLCYDYGVLGSFGIGTVLGCCGMLLSNQQIQALPMNTIHISTNSKNSQHSQPPNTELRWSVGTGPSP